MRLPKEAQFVQQFQSVFGQPTYQRLLVLLIGAIVVNGRRTVSRVLWAVRSLAAGHASNYHRVFSRSPWSLQCAGRVLAAIVLEWVAKEQPVVIVVDDTTEQHRGDHVYGKACHRDAVRSSRSHVVHLYGLKWKACTTIGCPRPNAAGTAVSTATAARGSAWPRLPIA